MGARGILLLAAGASAFPDCTGGEAALGPYGPAAFHNHTWEGKPLYSLTPAGEAPAAGWPLIVFMHGLTGQYGMYEGVVQLYASHGFVVVFPFIKSPKKDAAKFPPVTNTNGEYILHGIDFALNATKDPSSVLYTKVDSTRIVSAGHSMGATCSIMAAKRIIDAGDATLPALKLVVTQHPGICGPFGPPPWPDTWLKEDLTKVNDHVPVLFTTATNDGAFWPAPQTAKHELGCYSGSNLGQGKPTAFIQFSAAACTEDHKHDPFTDSGHNCPFKVPAPETPWVLTALKLYAQFDGNASTQCSQLLWGNGTSSLSNDSNVELYLRHP